MLTRGTFSIVAADLQAGEVGCAVQSKYFSVGSVVPWARAGVGAVATQAAGVAVYGERALAELAAGADPDDALARVLADDTERETRQLGIVTADGRAAAFTGASCLDWAGHRTGAGFAVQGNILAGKAVVDECRVRSRRPSVRSSAAWSPHSKPGRCPVATNGDSSRLRSSSSVSARGQSRARGSTASATCGSRITPSRSWSCGGWSASGRAGT